MSLIIYPADGWDSYISLVDADAYHLAMGNAGWTGDDAMKEVALRKATQYIEVTYAPKAEFLDPMHKNILAATAEAALRALTASLVQDISPENITEETIGPLTTKYGDAQNGGQIRYTLIDNLMRGLGGNVNGVSVSLYRV